jgi:preprotein translocase subunit SecE
MSKIKSFKSFLIQTKNEMKKVRWLKKKELINHTITVIVFVAIAGLFLAGVDLLISEALSIFK